MSPDALVLRDIHQPPAPAWWPPAPGWWVVAAIILVIVLLSYAFAARRKRRQLAIAALFDGSIERAGSPAGRVAAMSELLRRAARRIDPAADRLQGEAWLAFLDGEKGATEFSQGAGRLLLEGGYRRDVDASQSRALQALARRRYLQLMAARR